MNVVYHYDTQGVVAVLDDQTLFQANDEIAILNALSQTEVTARKLELYSALADKAEVRDFFKKRILLMNKTCDQLRKHLNEVGNS